MLVLFSFILLFPKQLNTYFGSAMASVDLNQDGLADLVVGAPMYSNDQEEGKVYVYLNTGSQVCLLSVLCVCVNSVEYKPVELAGMFTFISVCEYKPVEIYKCWLFVNM